jgi:CRP-like cAMP-binding protein
VGQGDIDPIELPMTRVDIGSCLGMTIETVSRSFAQLRADGIIRVVNSSNFEIMKPEKLRQLSR